MTQHLGHHRFSPSAGRIFLSEARRHGDGCNNEPSGEAAVLGMTVASVGRPNLVVRATLAGTDQTARGNSGQLAHWTQVLVQPG